MVKRTSLILLCGFGLLFADCGPSPKRMEEADVHFEASKRLYTKGDTIQALAEAEKAGQVNEKNEEVQNFLALLYVERQDPVRAEQHYQTAIKDKPDYAEALNNYCAFLISQNRYDDALPQCQKAIENVTYPTPERAYNNMALIYTKRGEPAKVTEMHQKALIHNKNFVFSLLYLGKNSYEKKDYQKAKQYLQSADQACLLSPKGSWGNSCPESQYQLALTYLQLRQTAPAIQAFEHCLSSDSVGDYKDKCEKSLRAYK